VAKYQSVDQFAQRLHEGEPFFLVRAQDQLSIIVLMHYAAALHRLGLDQQFREVMALGVAFSEWQGVHGDLVKVPD
jgi:hypothetical protein